MLGQAIKAEEVLFEIHDLSEPLIQGFVAESDLAHVRPGQKARVRLTADPSFVGEATVVRSGRVFGDEAACCRSGSKLDRPPAAPLLHSQLARLTLVRGRAATGVAVPLAAVVREGTRPFVFVRQKDGTFDRRPVETRRRGRPPRPRHARPGRGGVRRRGRARRPCRPPTPSIR